MARFSFPSPGPRSNDESWFRLGTVDVTTTLLVIGLSVVSMVAWAIAPGAVELLALLPSAVRSGEVWRIATWPLYNPVSLWAVLGLVFFYFFGRELERIMGRNRLAAFCAILTVGPGLVATGLALPSYGISTIQTACFLAYVLLYPGARSFFNIPLWVLGAVFLGIEVLQLMGLRAYREMLFLFVVLGTAALTMSFFGLTSHISWLPNRQARPARPKGPAGKGKGRRRGKANLQAVPTPPPVYRPPAPRPAERARQDEIDVLLDKIAAQGIDSLTPEERRRLDEASRRLRDDKH
jgi:hypothetical protein